MKKLLALLLALIMALSCVGAFAEEPEAEGIASIPEIPDFTVAWESNANIEALTALLPMFGIDEETMGLMQSVLPLLAETCGQIVFANQGLQFDIGIKGQTILTVAGEKVEGGYALASDILPSYVITLADETIEAIIEQFTAQAEEALSGVDMEALIENVTGYAMEFVSACMSAVSFGDAELGEYPFEDLELTFNCRMPVIVDMEAIKGAFEALISEIKSDEAIGGLIDALSGMGLPIDLSEDPEIILPEVTVYAYGNVDEEGNEVEGPTLVTAEATVEEVTVLVTVLVEEDGVCVLVEVPSQQTSVSVYFTTDDEGIAVSIAADAMGMQFMENIGVSIGDEFVITSESYFMDMENPIATETLVFAWGGERDFIVLDENKTAIGLEQIMADEEGEVTGALLADVMSNGLGNLIAKVSQIMPEEMVALMNMLSGAEAVEGAAE